MKKIITAVLALGWTLSAPVVSAQAQEPAPAQSQTAPTPESILASQVAEIASSSKLSAKAKQQRISALVRRSIMVATTDVKDPAQALAMAVELATAASRAAPDYTQAIINSVSSIPSIASIDGALGDVQSAVNAVASPNSQAASNNGPVNARTPSLPSTGGGGGGGNVVIASPSH